MPEPPAGTGSGCPSPGPTTEGDWSLVCECVGIMGRDCLPSTSWGGGDTPPDPSWCFYVTTFVAREPECLAYLEGRFSVLAEYIGSGDPPSSVAVDVWSAAKSGGIQYLGLPAMSVANGFNDAPSTVCTPIAPPPPGFTQCETTSSGTHRISVQIGSDKKGRYDLSVSASIGCNGSQNGCSLAFKIVGVVENP